MAGSQAERHLRIANGRVEHSGRVLDGIEDGNVIGAVLRRPIKRAISVDRGIALVAGNQVVQVVLFVHPVAQGYDDVALDPLRPLRLGMRQLAFRNTVGPIRQVLDGKRTHAGQLAHHKLGGLSRLHAARPSLFGISEVSQCRLNCPRGELT